MSVSQYIGNSIGLLYAVDGSGNILMSEPNTPKGVRNMRISGAASAPIAAERSAVGSITFTAAVVGNITAVTIAGVNQIGANVPATAGDTVATASDVAAAINGYTPASGIDFTASVTGSTVYIYSTPAGGAATNGEAITVSVSAVGITSTTVDFSGGSSQTGVYDTTVGMKFYLNQKGNASRTSLSGATEITKYIVVRGLQTGIVSKNLSVASSQLTGIDRSCAITQIFVDTESSAATDDLDFIETVDFVVGDVIRLTQFTSSRVVTVTDAGTSGGNVYLTNASPFPCQDNKSIELRLQSDNSLGLIWVENGRSVSQGYVSLSRVEMRARVAASTVVIGQSYFVYDIGQAGIILIGVDVNSVSSQGQYIGYFPDYQNESGDFDRVWSPFLASCTVGKLYAYNGLMYQSVDGSTGSDPSSSPTSEWLAIDITDTRYNKEILTVQYDLDRNLINQGADQRGNIVTGSLGFTTFKWGCDTCYSNSMYNCTGDIYNINGAVYGNSCVQVEIAGPYGVSSFAGNNLGFTQLLFANGDISSLISMIYCIGTSPTIQIENIGAGVSIVTSCTFGVSTSGALAIYLNNANMDGVVISSTGESSGAISIGCGSYNLINSQISLPINLSSDSSGLIVNHSSSNHEVTIDLDATMSGTTLTLPIGIGGAGVWNVTSAGAKTIEKIVGTTYIDMKYPITIKPANGKTTTILPTLIAIAATDNIVSEGGSTTLVGRTNGGDFYTIQRSGTMWQKINSKVNV